MPVNLSTILTEDVISIAQAAKEIQAIGGINTHIATVHRWARRGAYGIKLETFRVGARILTSRQAVTRFIQAMSDARDASLSS